MALTITEVLNLWNQSGVFSYVLPFLLIFAVVFAILEKSEILTKNGQSNRPILAIIAISISLLALQFDLVSTFFAAAFPRFGIFLSVILIILIFVGFLKGAGENDSTMKWTGIVLGAIVAIWAFFSWDEWFYGGWSLRNIWYYEDFWTLVVIGVVIWIIYLIARKPEQQNTPPAAGGTP